MKRVSALRLDTIRLALADRDMEILRTLAAYRLATGEQLRRLHFTDHASCEAATRAALRVLTRLYSLRLIDRLERRIGGIHAGSAGYVWHLASAGRRLLARENYAHSGGVNLPRVAATEPTERTVAHTLAVTEVGVRLDELAQAGRLDVIECVPEPAAWRYYLNAGGGRSVLKPDLWAVTAPPTGNSEDLWFVEVDMGREPMATVLRKAEQYEAYRRTGKEQQAQGAFPRVVWLCTGRDRKNNAERAGHITEALRRVGEQSNRIDPAVHRATTLDEFLKAICCTPP